MEDAAIYFKPVIYQIQPCAQPSLKINSVEGLVYEEAVTKRSSNL